MSYTLKVTRTETYTHHAPDVPTGHMQTAIRERIQRLREAKTPHTVSGNTITASDKALGEVHLEYVEDE